ncbi:hypothetical protein AB9F29_14475 [Falsihalocynthiibacter sp. S25ZX9]|uniref:hypothetical protein n=1 Tax=Falsihalocynthiibacter sp. S25ZX9 TaxID=3240870 RepID=UPI00350F5F09
MRKSVLVAWLFCIGVPVVAEQSNQPESTWEEVGRWIETPHHEKLRRLRRDPATSIAPFTTDGCSGGMSAAWTPVAQIIPGFAENYSESPPWEACCVVHDQAYYNAGETQTALESYNARLNADKTLMQCVLQDGVQRRDTLAEEFSIDTSVVDQAYTLIANGMYQAVRLGGGPCSGLSWRWGYGYPSCLWSN